MVNVILVDFRGFDTLGEITVLAIAALGIFAMLDGLRLRVPDSGWDGHLWATDRHPLIMQVIARSMLPLILLVAIYIFLRGHNLPGGGFIASLVSALALVLQYLADGHRWAQTRIRFHPSLVMVLGLLFALGTGMSSWIWGYPFLTSTFTHVHWPLVGDFELASAMSFDLGVYLVVLGAVVLILAKLGNLGELSRAAQFKRHSTPEKIR